MHAYTFRIVIEDIDDFYADVEIGANQNFEDFHKTIIDLADLKGNEMASFYFCDNAWKRNKELTLLDLSEPDMEEEARTFIMKDCVLAKCIDDPHQRLIYIYDFINMNTFYIELIKISEVPKGAKLPRIVKKCGELPKKGSTLQSKYSASFDEEAIEVYDEDDNNFSDEEGVDSLGEFGEEFSVGSGNGSNDEY